MFSLERLSCDCLSGGAVFHGTAPLPLILQRSSEKCKRKILFFPKKTNSRLFAPQNCKEWGKLYSRQNMTTEAQFKEQPQSVPAKISAVVAADPY